jgi:gas vesicle protein
MKRLFALGAAMGAALAYFFDPETGNRRRSMTRDRVLAFFRRTGHQAGRAGQAAKSQAYGATQKAVQLKERTKDEPANTPGTPTPTKQG